MGVFQNQPIDEVNSIAEELDLDFVQLHGEEDKQYIMQIKKPVIKSFTMYDLRLNNQEREIIIHSSHRPEFLSKAEFIILDRQIQGQGEMVDLEEAAKIAEEYKIFLAGGLTPENVTEIVQKVRPFAVDVAGGVETDGVQDVKKIRLFIQNAKNIKNI